MVSVIRRIWDTLPFPDQVKRLIIIFALLGVGWLLLRHKLVPETFGDLGHYRAASVDSIKALPISYLGHAVCAECHVDETELKSASYHRDLSCEICHGPGAKHLEDPAANQLKPPQERSLCTVCHAYNSSRPTGFPQIDPIVHNPVDPCGNCHNPHDPTPPSTPEQCGACHGEVARTKSISHHASLECTVCHETNENHKDNPRMFLPKKPQNRAFCGGCHATTADSPKNIPRIDLDTHEESHFCWECHYPHFPEAF